MVLIRSVASFPGRTIHLIGSIHSTGESVRLVESLSPRHIFIETTREILGLLRRNEHHSPRLVDLPSLVRYADAHGSDIHPIDTNVQDICGRVFEGVAPEQKRLLWKYVLQRKFCVPLANMAFARALEAPHNSKIHRFVTRWLLSHQLLTRCRNSSREGDLDDSKLEAIFEDSQNNSSFLVSPETDPGVFVELCNSTHIDQRLQRTIIDYRNEYMSHKTRLTVNTLPDGAVCAVIVGKNHLEGMYDNLAQGPDYTSPHLVEPRFQRSSFLDQILLASLLR